MLGRRNLKKVYFCNAYSADEFGSISKN